MLTAHILPFHSVIITLWLFHNNTTTANNIYFCILSFSIIWFKLFLQVAKKVFCSLSLQCNEVGPLKVFFCLCRYCCWRSKSMHLSCGFIAFCSSLWGVLLSFSRWYNAAFMQSIHGHTRPGQAFDLNLNLIMITNQWVACGMPIGPDCVRIIIIRQRANRS